MAHESRDPRSSTPDSYLNDLRFISRDHGEGLSPLHSATAMTDYDAFTGKEEFLSSEDDASPPKQRAESRAKAKKSRKAQRVLDSSNTPGRSLRPALDVLSRLRHDPAFSSEAFTIGYLDRHTPEVMELPLASWKGGEVTDEDFIPQHRILWFKRDADGKKVWDRKGRYDEIFGSGMVPVSGTEESNTLDACDADNAAKAPADATDKPAEDPSVEADHKKDTIKPGVATGGSQAS